MTISSVLLGQRALFMSGASGILSVVEKMSSRSAQDFSA